MNSDTQYKHFDVMCASSKLAQNLLFVLKVPLNFQEST